MVDDCLFCGIVAGNVPAQIVRDGERVLAFRDVNPQAPTHVLVIPREHYADLGELSAADVGLAGELFGAVTEVAGSEGLADPGYRVVVNSGRHGGQTVGHVHVHLLGGRSLGWPPG